MILDAKGRPMRRAIGFIGGFVVVSEILPTVESSVLVGAEVDLEDEGKGDAARTPKRMRRVN